MNGPKQVAPRGNDTIDARSIAVRVIVDILDSGATLDMALQNASLESAASAVRSLTYGALRGWFRHEAVLARLLSQPIRSIEPTVRALLSIALYEIEDARTPEYAVVDAAVKTAKAQGVGRAGGLVNAVLRRYLRERKAIDAEVARNPAARHAAPQWLAEKTRSDWPLRWTQILAAGDTQAPMWLRANSQRIDADGYLALLQQVGIAARTEPRVPYSVMLESPCDVQQLPGFVEGLVSVQDLGAQCVAFPLKLAPGQRVLDACAAPGGKTALMAERQPLAALVAVDVDALRLQRVRQNLERGSLHAEILVGDAGAPEKWWNGKPFDRILLDAPCSALGVIRRHPDIRVRKSSADIEKQPYQQARLLAATWQMLARGGRLIYGTCTVTRSENHDVIETFLAGTSDAAVLPPNEWAGWPGFGEGDGYGQQIFPGEAGADGFYYAVLTKQ